MAIATCSQSTLRTAGLLRRSAAALLDAVPALTLWWAVSLSYKAEAASGVTQSQWNLLDRSVDTLNTTPDVIIWPLVWCLLGSVVWHTLTVAVFGTSPGKHVVGLTLLSSQGERPGPLRSLVHALMRPLTAACLALGPLWALADPERRTLYDRLSGIYVTVDAAATGEHKEAQR